MVKEDLDLYLKSFRKRYILKKTVNAIINLLIAISCFIAIYDSIVVREYVFTDRLRYMTWNGSIFTSAVCLVFSIINIIEIIKDTEMTSRYVYYLRLSSATTELVILLVVLIGLLPSVPDSPDFTSVTGFVMHLFIPIMTLLSFTLNDAPIGKLRFWQPFHGTWFITFYAVIMTTLLLTGRIPEELAPYSFLLFTKHSFLYDMFVLLVIYGSGYLFAYILASLNRRLSWVWFKDLVRKDDNNKQNS